MKQRKKKKRGLIILCALLLLMITGVAALVIYLIPYSQYTLDLSLLQPVEEQRPARLYAPDSAGDAPYHFVAEGVPRDMRRQIPVTYEQSPPKLIQAFVAIEDKRFYEHRGVDLRRTLHAAWQYVTRQGNAAFGGSTITQQLIKNLTGDTDRTADRKLKEIFMALDLERKVDKETILTSYLNVINLGGGCYGIGAAADAYFGKTVDALTLGECAALAAITNQPTLYNPRTHPDNNQKRRELILGEMRSQGYITSAEYEEALSQSVILCEEKRESPPMTSWYTEMVMSDVQADLQSRCGYSREQAARLLSGGGLTIETVMDEKLQEILTEYYEEQTNFPVGLHGRPQSGMIIMDPENGKILAVAGAIGKKNAYYLQNYATDTKRPAGSVIKPLGVYAPALKEGLLTWGTVFEDAPAEEKNGRPWPKNADGLYRGRVTVSDSIAHSLNTVAVTVAQRLGVAHAFDFLRNTLHMESLIPPDGGHANDCTLSSVALGQQNGGVTVRELTAAYTVFVSGRFYAPISYSRVLDREGRVLLENKIQGEPVLTAAEADMMTRLLEEVTERGTAAGLYLKEREGVDVAGKTGTTQNNCDRWFVGYTPRLLAGVWMGYDYPMPMDDLKGNPCLGIFDEVMGVCEGVYEGKPPKKAFDRHPSVIPVRICPLSGEIATPECYEAMGLLNPPQTGWYEEGTEPKDCCHLHFSFWQDSDPLVAENHG